LVLVVDYLQDENIDVVLSHPKKTKAIASAKIMTDRISSETLAHLLRSNLLPTSYILPRQFRQTRDLLRYEHLNHNQNGLKEWNLRYLKKL
jgi:transposase